MTAPTLRPVKPPLAPATHSGLDIAALICAFFIAPAGLILGIAGIASAHGEGRRASWLSVAAVVIVAVEVIAVVAVIIAITANQPDAVQQYVNCVNQQISNPYLVCPTP